MGQPEEFMKIGFKSLATARLTFKRAALEYQKRDNDATADKENAINIAKSLQLLSQAYDEVSAIWENDINV